MKTILITGGTNGIGKGLALSFLKKGDSVIVVGSNATKGALFSAEAKTLGVEDRAYFFQADLRLVQENQRIIEEVKKRFPSLDMLVLCAQDQKYSTAYVETTEGFEMHFSLYYLSRYLLSFGLKSCLEHSDNPMIVNVCAPGMPGTVQWDDLQLKHMKKFTSIKAILHGSRLNDLLGVAFTEHDTEKKIKYILYNPGAVQTSGAIEVFKHPMLKFFVKFFYSFIGTSIEKAIQPILELVENSPQSPLTAFQMRKAVSLTGATFERKKAQILFEQTSQLFHKA